MPDRLSQTLVAVFSGAAIAFSSQGQNLLLNGDFELPGYPSPPAYRYLSGAAWQPQLGTLPGWTILDDGALEPPYLGKLPNYTNVVQHGEYGIALNQGSGIRTDFPVRRATPYQLSFWVRLQGNSTVQPLRVSCAGFLTNVPITQVWTRHQVEFEATTDDAAAVLQFDNVSAAGAGRTIGLDDISLAVRLTAVEPLSLLGWNADVVLENQPGRGATFFDAGAAVWFESGLGERTNGLPADRRIASQLTPGLTFGLPPYDQPNVLQLTQTNGAGFLSLANARPYSKLYVLAASGNGGGIGALTVHFTDGSHTTPIPFFAPDWWDGTSNPAPRRPAAGGFARSLGSGPELQYSFTSPGFSLHQTDVDLSVGSDAGKPVARIEFTKANGQVPWATSIFAVSGEPLPSPPALVIRDIQVLPDQPVQIRVPASADAYYLLYRGEQVQQIALPRDIRLGEAPEVTLSDPVPRPDTAFYRVEAVPVASPRDTDGDGLDDVYELRHRPACDPLVADADRDSDGDGKSNLEEFRLGTSPEQANVPPTVALTQPAPDSAFPAPASIDLAATATDPDGTVTKVEFFVGNAKLGEDTEPPYTLIWAAAPAGNYSLSARAVDNFGQTNASAAVPIRVELQNRPPAVTLAAPLAGAVFTAPGTVPITVNAVDPDGTIAKVEIYAGVDRIAELTAAPFTFTWTNVAGGDYPLFARALDDRGAIALSLTVPIQVVQPAVVAPATFTSSPADGEDGVAVTRETVLRLSLPLVEGTVVANDTLFATAAGRRILSRSELSSDRRTLTLFYLENLPASSRVRVSVKGDTLRDALGRGVDADADGVAGGEGLIEFDTLSTTPVAGTAVIGRVFASELVPGAAITTNALNGPLEGVTISVDGAEETLRTTTDAMGNFKLTNCPSGRFFVHVDGRTAKDSQWPNGAYYPFVGKAWEAAAGREDNLAGGNGEIYLPLVPGDALTTVSATQDTTVTFSPTVLSNNPALAGVSITVPANSLLAENGTRGGRIGIAPVSPDRLPEPLPTGLELPLVITVQTDGPQNFDRTVPVRFPNLPNPVTGFRLPAGGKSALWSFDHDTGEWEVMGSMTVTDDGQFVVSDPGVGLRKPGWHGTAPGSVLSIIEDSLPSDLSSLPEEEFDGAVSLALFHADDALSLVYAAVDPIDPEASSREGLLAGLEGFFTSLEWADEIIEYDEQLEADAQRDGSKRRVERSGKVSTANKTTRASLVPVVTQLKAAAQELKKPGQFHFVPMVTVTSNLPKRPVIGESSARKATRNSYTLRAQKNSCHSCESRRRNVATHSRSDSTTVRRASITRNAISPVSRNVVRSISESDGSQRIVSGVAASEAQVVIFDPNSGAAAITSAPEISPAGERIDLMPYSLRAYEPGFDLDADGVSDASEFALGTDPDDTDSDDDGISDGIEVKNGTNPLDGRPAATGVMFSADTPGTAVDVSALNSAAVVADSEAGVAVFNVFNGLNPTLVAQVDTPGTALSVTIAGNLVAVADGPAGLAVLDLTRPAEARVVHQVPVGTASARAVATLGSLALVGTDAGELAAVDLTSGELLAQTAVGGRLHDLGVEGDGIYVLTDSALLRYTLLDGEFVAGPTAGISGYGPEGITNRRRLFVGGGIAYATGYPGYDTFDVSNPAQITRVGNVVDAGPNSFKQIVSNGSGLGIAAVGVNPRADGTHDVWLYDVSDPTQTTRFITTLPTPGTTYAVSIFNGLAYAADGESGLQVINYLAYDNKKTPPTIQLTSNLSGDQAEEGSLVRLTARVTDDVQVRNVEFYLDGQLAVTDGNFPFEQRFTAPLMVNGRTNFTVQARAYDTGGNATWSESLTFTLAHDLTPPRVRRTIPAASSLLTSAVTVIAYLSEPMDSVTLNDSSFQIRTPGPDNRFGTADDGAVRGGTLTYQDETRSVIWTAPQPLPFGGYEVVVQAPFADRAGLTFAAPHRSQFWVLPTAPGADDDGDGLTNLDEVRRGLNPLNADTDNDGSSDSDEIIEETNPLDPKSRPQRVVYSSQEIEVVLGGDLGVRGVGTTVAMPLVEVSLPGDPLDPNPRAGMVVYSSQDIEVVLGGELGVRGIGTTLATPLVEVSLPGDPLAPNPRAGTVVYSSQDIEVMLGGDQGVRGIGTTVATPLVEVSLPGDPLAPTPRAGTVVYFGKEIEVAKGGAEGIRGIGTTLGSPWVEIWPVEDISNGAIQFESDHSQSSPQPSLK